MAKCPSCDVELIPLVAGINQCPQCKKIIKGKTEKKAKIETDLSEFKSGEWFMNNTAVNKKWEICEKGLIIDKTSKSLLAGLICHTPIMPNSKYIRLSWFKNSTNLHAGMQKISNSAELDNIIKVLIKIDDNFDDNFDKISKKSKKVQEKEIDEEDIFKEYFNLKDKICPKCKTKMKKSKNKKYFSCESCGEIVVLEDGMPIFDLPTEKLPLSFSGNFPVNYYLPEIGITYKWLMAEWKAAVIIYAKENPDKRWLRFYWWIRKLQDYISSDYVMGGSSPSSLAWTARKGAGSTNIYDKALIKPLIETLKILKKELKW